MRQLRGTVYLLSGLVLALIAQFREVRSSHFRGGLIEYRVNQANNTLDVAVTSFWRGDSPDTVSVYDSGGSYLFTTSSGDTVGDGYDALGNSYVVLRFVAYSASSCLAWSYLLFEAYWIWYVPAVMLIDKATSSGGSPIQLL
ncbi:hypothetical protein VOLCADRAFT_89110 [Volvox carteri f. nagariensis]|uniref:Uncharacterized protein n=1 Tax=Volvox carteri f. nagariensis TaxID=3068 RepID=D8TQU0_VOLCA|nr:uncharacterized protein VOLCADRAFT_89110 [Volvox carteri f. nagariensis]EFJ50091.1 hypothetical protein VOLCADRAFT_89110 [Volvox carteri f. nagariensis]|eukprot:XP_002948711.1 hypothetical protein VOLCADRAFT_89110 [Volvox carteri f. nagariensis]